MSPRGRYCQLSANGGDKFIWGRLTDEHGLDTSEKEKPIVDAEDFTKVLQCHWLTDTNVFPQERQRIQLPTILMMAGFTGSRAGALLRVRYRDLSLYYIRDPRTGESKLQLQLTLRFTKSGKARRRP